jgi:hypothetical protein
MQHFLGTLDYTAQDIAVLNKKEVDPIVQGWPA